MKTFRLALLLILFSPLAQAADFDTIMAQQDNEQLAQSTKLDIRGFDIPEGYIINGFVYQKGFSTTQCFDITLRPGEITNVRFSSDNLSKHLGKRVEVTVTTPNKTKTSYAGIINKIAFNAQDGGYNVTACSEISLLTLHSSNKLYTNMSRIEALQNTMAAHNLNFKFELKEHYPKIEFLTRYNETDLNFVKHVMEEVGIFFTSKIIDGKETYFFTDNIANLAQYSKTIDFKELNTTDNGQPRRSPPSLSIQNSLQSDNYRMMDFDLLQNQVVTASANNETGNKVQEEYQISDYPSSMLEKVAKVKLAALNSGTNALNLETRKTDVDIADQIKVGDKSYYVISSYLDVTCTGRECSTSNSLSLIPTQTRYATQIATPVPMTSTSLIGFVSNTTKDAQGRIGFRYPWMDSQPETIMYRAPLSENAKHLEYKNGDKVVVTFINGFIDRPIIVDKM